VEKKSVSRDHGLMPGISQVEMAMATEDCPGVAFGWWARGRSDTARAWPHAVVPRYDADGGRERSSREKKEGDESMVGPTPLESY
jgi:hypothetical protein